MAVLDQQNGIGNIRFGTRAELVPGLQHRAAGIGKRWRTTRLYARPDSALLGLPPTSTCYWFRQNQFIGVTVEIPVPADKARVLAYLRAAYGPSQVDPQDGETEYWLGQRTYIILEPLFNKSRGWELHIASLAMLNEQVVETAVRAQARAQLGWQPDSLGLVRQYKR